MRRRDLLQLGVATCAGGAARIATGQAAPAGSVPLELLHTGDIGALPAIELVLGGQRTRWLVDSGSTAALVSPALATRLRLRRLSSVPVSLAGGQQTVDRVELPALPLPGRGAGASSALAIDLPALFGPAGARVDGLIGTSWLRDAVTTFDFAGGHLRWAATAAEASPGAVILPLRWDGALPVLKLAIGTRAADEFLFDTGNAGALVVFSQRAQALLAEAGDLPETTVRELGGMVRARYARIERLAAAGLVWTDVPAALEAGATARRGGHFDRLGGSVGMALFAAGAVTLDGPAGRLLIEQPGLPTPPPLPGGFGLMLEGRTDGSPVVGAVIEGSPAFAAGIAAGDEVTAIDGAGTRGWTPLEAWRTLAGRDDAAFELTRAGTALRPVRLQRQRFFPLLR